MSDSFGENPDVKNKTAADVLLAIKAATENLRLEITGGSALHDEEGVGVAENNSLKQVLEEILFQIKAVNTNMEALRGELLESPKNKQETSVEVKQPIEPGMYPVVEIQFSSTWKWREWIKTEATAKLQYLRTPGNGNSLQGTTLQGLAKTIPRHSPKIRDFPNLASIRPTETKYQAAISGLNRRKPIIIDFCNSTDCHLRNPQLYFAKRGSTLRSMNDVRPWSRELTCLYAGENDTEVCGLCSYDIPASDLRLIVRFAYVYSTYWEFSYDLALSPVSISLDASVFTKEIPRMPAMEFNFEKNSIGAIQSKDFVVTGYGTIETNLDVTLLTIKIVKWTQPPCEPVEWKPIRNGTTFPGSPLDLNDLFKSKVGCVFEIENRLNVKLEDFMWHMDRATDYALLPPVMTSFTREIFYVMDDMSTQGMISYNIENTYLRLALVFWTRPECNQFAMGFIHSDDASDATTMTSLMVKEVWKTSPYICANAEDGEQVLDYLNLRITAVMTTDARSSLKLNITAF